MSEWQDISTVPRDGTYVQIRFGLDDEADEDGPYIGAWLNGDWWDQSGTDYAYGTAQPTHWKPVTPPKDTTGDGG